MAGSKVETDFQYISASARQSTPSGNKVEKYFRFISSTRHLSETLSRRLRDGPMKGDVKNILLPPRRREHFLDAWHPDAFRYGHPADPAIRF
jgi:hypothetical protein